MKTVTIGRTVYKINDDRDIFAAHAKCTGKHKIVKSKGPERRYFPDYFYSTADYVTRYYALNSGRGHQGRGAPYGGENTLTGFYENLSEAPAATYTQEDQYES
jgi:hypothetical protein